MDEYNEPGQALRAAAADGTLQIPGAPSALVGRLIERMGFSACYLSGGAYAAGSLALPDVGLNTLTEITQQTYWLTRAIGIPVIVDADTGFGEAVHVARAVGELEAAGAAAIQIEDQQAPKRCGQLSGVTLIEPASMCAKIEAALAARVSEATVILAKTDARQACGLVAAIERAEQYVAAGADWVLPDGLATAAEFEQFARAFDVPLVANMTEFGRSPLIPFGELQQMGYAAVLYPDTLFRVAMRAIEASLAVMQSEGTQASIVDLMQTREELYELLDYEDFGEPDPAYGDTIA